MSQDKPVLLVVCGRSCASIDWILPVLHAVAGEAKYDVKFYFKSVDIYEHLRNKFCDLSSILHSCDAELLTKSRLLEQLPMAHKSRSLISSTWRELPSERPLRRLKKLVQLVMQLLLVPLTRWTYRANRLEDTVAAQLLADGLSERKVAFVLFDHPIDVPNYAPEFGDSEIIYFPHGTLNFEQLENNWRHIERMIGREPTDGIPPDATWLIGRPEEQQYYRRLGAPCRLVASGHPKFDPRWSDVLRQRVGTLNPSANDQHPKPRVLLLSIPEWKFSSAAHRQRLLKQLFTVAKNYDWDLQVRLHPQESQQSFRAIAQSANYHNIRWCENSVSGAATQVDFVVCFPTSAAMDAVAAGAPVVEFFDFADQQHTSFTQSNGKTTSTYRAAGLVEPADNEEDLQRFAHRAAAEKDYLKRLHAAQLSRLATIFVNHESGISRVLQLLQQLGDGKTPGQVAA